MREKRRKLRAVELLQKDDEATVKLENAAIEHSKPIDSATLGKYNIWRKDHDEINDGHVRLIRDQIIMAKVYALLAREKNQYDLRQDLLIQIKESQHVLGDASSDAELLFK